MIPFSLLWSAFAVFWEYTVVTNKDGLFAAVWGIPFCAIAVYTVVGRFGYKHYRKKHTLYGITTQRAVIISARLVRDISLPHRDVTVRRTRDGRHVSVLIGNAAASGPATAYTWFYANTGLERSGQAGGPFAFYDVADPNAMLEALEQARLQPRP
jgi:steroid 5-alpha reductase family enzyme